MAPRRLGILLGALLVAGCAPVSSTAPSASPPPAPGATSPVAGRSEGTEVPDQPAESTASVPADAQQVVARVRAEAGAALGVPDGEVLVTRVEQREWPDTALGCPQAGAMYAQVIVPGFLVEVRSGGKVLQYHTDRDSRVVLCQQG